MFQKIVLLFCFGLVSISNLKAQNYLKKIAEATCECLEEIDPELKGYAVQMEIGLCIMVAAKPYEAQLKKDHRIDLAKNLEKSGEALGVLIGLELATACPDQFMDIYTRMQQQADSVTAPVSIDREVEPTLESITGTVQSIDAGQFLGIEVVGDDGFPHKLYVIDALENPVFDLGKHKGLVGKKITCEYEQIYVYDPKINENKTVWLIRTIKLTN
jgi:hypothetical protein